jgi:hypothetical protein
MKTQRLYCAVTLLVLVPMALTAQALQEREIPLKPWPAPLYFQHTHSGNPSKAGEADVSGPSSERQATIPVNALAFVAITPCRVVDTRAGFGFTGAFGPPTLAGQATRTFPIQSSPNCAIPSIAQAYSFNVTVVPPGFLGYVTVYPTGVTRPNASTLNSQQGFIVANAAIVPAGTNGSVDVFANNATDLVMDINGYYAPQSGITMAQGTAGAPALSFSGDAGTGIFSSGPGVLNFSSGGTNRLTVRADGDLDLSGNMRKGGALFLHNLGGSPGANTAVGLGALGHQSTGQGNTALGVNALFNNTAGTANTAIGTDALYSNMMGGNNTAIGVSALFNNTTGGNNIAIGDLGGFLLTLGSFNILIGNSGQSADDHTVRIGDFQTRTFIAGIRGITTSISNAVPVMIDSNGNLARPIPPADSKKTSRTWGKLPRACCVCGQ